MTDRTSSASAFARIATPARQQYGVVDPATSASMLTDHHRKFLRASGLLDNRYRGVDVISAVPRSPEQDLLAAIVAVDGLAAAAARSAAATWGMSDRWPPAPEIVVAGTRRPRVSGVIVHRNTALEPRHVTTFRRIPVLRPAVALISLAAVEGDAVVSDCLIRGLKKRLLTVGGIRFVLDDLGRQGRDGTDRLRRVKAALHLDSRPPDGVLEGRFLIGAEAKRLPAYVFQFRVADASGRFIGRVDFAWPELKVLVELDGWEERASPQALAAELERQNRLVAGGWLVLRFPWWRVVCEPVAVATAILAVLRTVTGR